MAATAGSAEMQAALWGRRARDWGEAQEPRQAEMYPPVLDAAGLAAGSEYLDVGCGTGVAAQVAHDRGARVSGIDATEAFVELARERVPAGDFRTGEMEALPYADGAYDVVTGFNSFQYAADPARALGEARRVSRGVVALVTWGDAAECDTAACLAAIGSFLPPPPPGAAGPFALSAPGALEALAARAGLEPVAAATYTTRWDYPDLETALRATLASGPAGRAIDAGGEDAVRAAITEALGPFRTSAGSYVLENAWRYLVAR
jgi:SAM-dependent methyltransferase